jgi:hypothetical protein
MALEHRRLERRDVALYLPVTEVDSNKRVGILVDISPEGFKLESPEPVASGQIIHLRLYFTKELGSQASVVFSGRSRWCHPDYIDPSTYNVGFEFINLSPQSAQHFQHLVEEYGAQSYYAHNTYRYPWK